MLQARDGKLSSFQCKSNQVYLELLQQPDDEGNKKSRNRGHQFHVLCLCFFPTLNQELRFRFALFSSVAQFIFVSFGDSSWIIF